MRVIQGNGFRIFVGQPEGSDADPAEVAQQLLDALGRSFATAVCWKLLGKLSDLDDDDERPAATALGQLLEGDGDDE